jgi:hypothetical protein
MSAQQKELSDCGIHRQVSWFRAKVFGVGLKRSEVISPWEQRRWIYAPVAASSHSTSVGRRQGADVR